MKQPLTTTNTRFNPNKGKKINEELFKKSPALAVADHILSGGLFTPKVDPEKEPSLADMFVAQTYVEAAHFHGREKKVLEEAMTRYRNDMRHAHRFVLDDQFVEYCTHAATAPATKILARLQYATLPYDTTWIEFNLRAKVRTIRAIHQHNDPDLSTVAPRCGMLMQRINDTDAVVTLVSDQDGTAQPHLAAYFFSTVERDFIATQRPYFGCWPVSYHQSDEVDTPRMTMKKEINPADPAEAFRAFGPSIGKASLWGYTTKGHHAILKNNEDRDDLTVPMFLCRHGDVGFSRYYDAYRPIVIKQDKELQLHQTFGAEVTEFTGHLRWVVTLLAMLNEVPVHTELVARSHQMRIDHLRKKQYLDYHRVTLRLPKTKPLPWIERHLAGHSDRRHRAHEVRSFWRTYLNETACKREEHEWEYDHDEGYRLCGKCMAYSRLIKEHVRGNPELGWVRKEYVVKKEKQ